MAHNSAGAARWLADAFRQHQAGQWREAEAGYRRVLSAQPRHARCLYLLGSLLAQQRQFEHALGPLTQAAALDPNLPEAHNNRGIALKEMGRTDEAIDAYDHALRARPGYAEAANNKGIALQAQGRLAEAVPCFAQAVDAKPAYIEAWNNQGIALNVLGQYGEAARCFAQAIHLEPGSPRAHNNLGNAYMAQSRFAEALEAYDRALALDDTVAEVHSNRGTALKELSRFDEARAALARALRIQPAYPDALSNLATCLLAEGRTDDALEAYNLALSLDPEHVDARWNRALALLITGDWETGWAEYEWRFRKFALPCQSEMPRWDGASLDGKTILVCAEQGAGDTLKFVRYLPLLKAQGARVVFACPPALRALIESCPGIDTMIAPHETITHDVWIPLLSLPGLLGTTPDTVPQNVPYLSVPQELADKWQAKLELAAPGTIKVGLCWAGSPDQKNDHNRSARLADFAPLASVPGVTFVSLQKGDAAAQADAPPPGMTLVSFAGDIHDFADTAALMAGLDLIVTVDTSVAHLAGALGLPVWTLLPAAAPWHYLHGRADSPWYPTMTLFQQKTARDWAGVFAQVTEALLAAVAAPVCAGLVADGEAAYGQNKLAQARACFMQVLEIDPSQTRALSNLAVLDYADGRYEDALAWLDRALAIDPADANALANKELCREALQRTAPPRVSVVVPCFKQAHLLPDAVRSVVAQTYPHWELIIVDDGSPDNTREVAHQLIARYPQHAIRLVERPNGGLSAARNTGVGAATGEYLLPLDADDQLHPMMLEKTVAALQARPADAVAYTHVQHFGAQDDIWHAGPFTPEAMAEANRLVCSALYKREVYEAVGGYSEDMPAFEDWDFWLSALEKGYTGCLVPEALFQYRKTPTSMLTEAEARRAMLTAHLVMRHPALYSLDRRVRAARLLSLPLPAGANVSVSVVVPCYNYAHTLTECVESVVAQTYLNWELIIVDDGSPDNTREVARQLIAAHPECAISLVETPNAGVGTARNIGIGASAGQYILPLDADDKLHPTMLEKTVALLESFPEAAICYTDVQMFGTQDKVWLCGPLTLEHSRLENTVAHCCLFRREVFAAVGGYSTRPGYEDWEFWLDALDQGFEAVHLPAPLFLYRQWTHSKFVEDSKKRDRFVAEIVLRRPHLYHPSRVEEARQTLALPLDTPPVPTLSAPEDSAHSERQRVMLAMNWFFPHVGGEEKLSEDIGVALVQAGFDVEIATRALPERTHHTHRGMRIHSLAGSVGDEFQALVAARKPHAVVVIGGPEIEFLPAAAQIPAGGPRIVIVPCIKPDSYKDVHAIPALRKALEAAAQRADVTVTSSRYGYDARLFSDLQIDSVYVPNAVNRTEPEGDFRARYNIPRDTRLLLDVSNMRREKNHAGLLHHLRDRPGDWHLVLIGCPFEPTPHVATHVELLAAHDPRVTIIPGASSALIAAALEEADLLLLPSLADATPLVLLEAMSQGLPWIATPECGSAHDHAGGLMLPLPQFGPAIDFLLHNEPARLALGGAGYAHWQACYTYDIIGPRYAALVSGASAVPDLQAPAEALAQTEAVRALFAAQPAPLSAGKAEIAVSVVIAAQHARQPLEKTLEAYASQTLAPSFFEVIIADTRPAGGAYKAIDSAAFPFAVTIVRDEAGQGEAFVRSAALLQARGEVVLLMTDTLAPAPDYLEQHLRTHQKYPAPHVGVLGQTAGSAGTAHGVTRYIVSHTEGMEINFDAMKPEESADARALATHGVSVKRAFLLGHGIYSEHAGAQMHAELGWRLKDDGLRFCYCREAVAREQEPLSWDAYCARQTALGRAAAHLAARKANPLLLFWLGVHNAEDRLDTLNISAQSARQVGAQLAALDKTGLDTLQKKADFLPALVPALGRLCRIEAERLLLSAYKDERDALLAQDDALGAPTPHGPKVSVIIPCYKYAHYLSGAIASLAAQTYANWEAVIVDDGSPDNTVEVAQSLIAAYPDRSIRLITQSNTGHPSFARNWGIRETDGAYILCLDADDEIAPTFLAECVGLLERETTLSLAYTDQWRFTDDGAGMVFHCGDWHPTHLSQYLPLGVCTLFRRQAWTDAGGWRAVGYEDWDFWLACAEAGHRGLRIPKPLYRYRKHGVGKYELDKSRGYVNKAWLAVNHPALHDDTRLRWARGVIDTDRWLAAPTPAHPEPLVSVILTATGGDERELEHAVQSVRAQTYPHLEIIVAGPGASSLRPSENILIAHAAHVSMTADQARTHALDCATGKYVAYLDSGTQWTPEHLANLVGFLEATRYRAAYADAHTPGEDIPPAGFDSLQILVQNTVPLCGLVHERACLTRTGSFDLSLPALADWEFIIRLSRFFDLAHLRTATVVTPAQRTVPAPGAPLQAMQTIYARYRALTEQIPLLHAQQQAALEALSRPSSPPRPIILTATVCRERKLDLYAPCPCGSGKKLKFCHYNQPADLAWPAPPRLAQDTARALVLA